MKQSYDAIFWKPLRWCVLVAVLLWSQLAHAQTYLLPTSGITTVTTCAGTLYDDGGPTGYYSANALGGTTLVPATAGNKIRLQFNQFNIDPYYDVVRIYDGSSTSAPLIGEYTNYNLPPASVYATNATGSLTVVLQSDYYYNLSGIEAAISCVTTVPLADLAVQGASVSPLSTVAGNPVTLSCSIYNIGAGVATSSNVGYYFSTDATLDATDVLLGNSTGYALSPGSSNYRSITATIPATTAPGNYYILFAGDYLNQVSESNENNNVASVNVTVTPPSVDLTILQPSVTPTSTAVGTPIYMSCYILNTGNAVATSSSVGFYISTNTTLDASDVLLTSQYGGPLTTTYSSSRFGTAAIPTGLTPGAYYILFVADYQGQVMETNETNNVASVAITVAPPGVDLIVQQPSLYYTSTVAGGTVQASASILNQGNVTATSSTMGFYLSTNNTLDASDVLLSTVTGGTLAANISSYRSANLLVPVGTAAGSYYVLFVADPANVVTETNETNNVSSVALTVIAPTVDLSVTYPYLSLTTVAAGASTSASCYLNNLGNAVASPANVGFYLSTDNVFSANDVLVGSQANTSLYGGGYLNIYSTIMVPIGTTSGTYYVLFVADPANLVAETNENNNVASITIQVVAPGIDLQISQVFMNLTSVAPGTSVGVTSYIYNAGNTSSPSSNVGYYLSTNATLDASDVLMNSTIGGLLGAYQSFTSYSSVTIPTGTAAGNYYLLAVADPLNAVMETNETNNVGYYQFTVTGPFTGTIVPYTGSNTVTTCSTTVYDHGGFGNYSDNANGMLTINPGTPNSRIQLSFNSFAVETCCDRLMIYDGPDAQSPLLATLTTMPSLPIMATNSTGALTLVFTSDGSVTASGFDAAVTCVTAPTILPDLLLTQIGASPSSVPAGNNLSLSATVANQGGGSATSSAVGYYLSTNQVLDASDILLGTSAGTSLAASVSANRQLVAVVPASITPGAYYVLFMADPLNAVAEANETNNLASLAVTVTTGLASREQTAGYGVAVAPNPVANGNALRVQMTGVGAACTASVDLFNALGQRMSSQQLQLGTGRANQAEIPTRGLATGVYVLHLTGPNLNVTRRVVIE